MIANDLAMVGLTKIARARKHIWSARSDNLQAIKLDVPRGG